MSTTLYATFSTASDAERAAGALMDHGLPSTAISYVLPSRLQPPQTQDPGVGTIPGRDHQPRDVPAPTPTLSAPPAPLGGASGLDYHPVGQREATRAVRLDGVEEIDSVVSESGSLRMQTPAAEVISSPSAVSTLARDTPEDTVENDRGPHIVDMNRIRPDAATGVTTTSAADAAKGALEGAGIGLGLGIVLGLATVLIPGVGLVAGAGALAAGLAAATGAAGGIAGGVYGYLVDQGLPPDHAQRLAGHIENGAPILSVSLTSSLSEQEIMPWLDKYGVVSVETF